MEKRPKISTNKSPPGGEATEKRPKSSKKKKHGKIALLSLCLPYLYHVWKSRGGEGPGMNI